MPRNFMSFLTVLLLLAALLALTAGPAAAQTSGSVKLDCVTLKWQVKGPDSHQVAVTTLLSGKPSDSFLLTPQEQYYDVNHRRGSCPMSGTFGLINISKPGHGTFEIAIVVEQGDHVDNFDGAVANW